MSHGADPVKYFEVVSNTGSSTPSPYAIPSNETTTTAQYYLSTDLLSCCRASCIWFMSCVSLHFSSAFASSSGSKQRPNNYSRINPSMYYSVANGTLTSVMHTTSRRLAPLQHITRFLYMCCTNLLADGTDRALRGVRVVRISGSMVRTRCDFVYQQSEQRRF